MAKLQFGAIVIGARGKYNGSQFSVNRSGAVLQNKCQQRKGATTYQSAVRSSFSFLSRHWKSLTPTEQATNNVNALQYPYTDKYGAVRYFSGYQLLLRSNINRRYSDLAPINVVPVPPPAGLDILFQDYTFSISSGGARNIHVVVDVLAGVPADYSLQFFVSPAVSSGVANYTKVYKFLTYEPATLGEGNLAVTPFYYADTWDAGLRVFLRMVVIHNASGIEVGNFVVSGVIVQL